MGVSSQDELVRLIEKERKSGVFLTVLGFGRGNLKDSTMEKLADTGNGNYAYIDTISEANKVLVQEAGGTLITIAKDVKFQVEFNPEFVSSYRLIGYENRIMKAEDFNDDKKDAGEIGAGHTVTALYEIIPANRNTENPAVDPLKYQSERNKTAAAGFGEIATVKIRYKKPDGFVSKLLIWPVSSATIPYEASSENVRFASAASMFGMILRDSKFKGSSNYNLIIEIAEKARQTDPHGYRAEFISLVKKAKSLNTRGGKDGGS